MSLNSKVVFQKNFLDQVKITDLNFFSDCINLAGKKRVRLG